MKKYFLSLLMIGLISSLCQAQVNRQALDVTTDEVPLINCNTSWKQAHMGVSVNMLSDDIDSDGIEEIICIAGFQMFEYGNYWYVLEYNPSDSLYYQTFVSRYYDYDDGHIMSMELLDVNQDGRKEIVFAFDGKRIEIYDAASLSLTNTVYLPYDWNNISEMLMGDADNDGAIELICASQEETYLLYIDDFTVEATLGFGAVEIVCGNVDADPQLELVFSFGEVFELTQSGLVSQWIYKDFMYGDVQLADVDDDGMDEIVAGWDSIYVYDADVQQLKWKAEAEYSLESYRIADTDDDGTLEIVYSTTESLGRLYCVHAANGEIIWQRNNIEANRLLVANTDNVPGKELIITSGANDTGADFMTVYDLDDFTEKWQSKAVEDPFTDVEVADVDDDGELEIVTLTEASADYWAGAILSIYNLATRKLEWQCGDQFFQGVNHRLSDILVCDYDNDDSTEIIIPAGYNGARLYIIDGATHTIEHDQTYYPDPKPIHDIEFMDINGDGQKEFVAAAQSYVYIINPADFSLTWTSPAIPWNYDYVTVKFLTGNTDLDPNPEIVVLNKNISVIDPITNEIWSTEGYNYTSFCLYDYNDDGLDDIIAGDEDGKIEVINGVTHEITGLIDMNVQFAHIGGINITHRDFNNMPIMIFTFEGAVYFWDFHEAMLKSEKISLAGQEEILLTDYNNDGRNELFVASTCQVAEFSYDCYKCLGFKVNKYSENYFCTETGSIILEAEGGMMPYSYNWGSGAGPINEMHNLLPGVYSIEVNDNQGCSVQMDVTLNHYDMGIWDIETIPDFSNTPQCEGKARIILNGGTPPFSYFEGTEQLSVSGGYITGLCAGEHTIKAVDKDGCEKLVTLVIDAIVGMDEKNEMTMKLYPVPASDKVVIELSGIPQGRLTARIYSLQGVSLLESTIADKRTELNISAFAEGIYILALDSEKGRVVRKLIITVGVEN